MTKNTLYEYVYYYKPSFVNDFVNDLFIVVNVSVKPN